MGRITIRTRRLNADAREELDRAITRARQAGHLEQLGLLKSHAISPTAFLAAAREGRVPSLQPTHLLEPLYQEWLKSSDIRDSSRRRYEQSWDFIFPRLPGSPTLGDLTKERWKEFIEWRRTQVGNATLNRDRAAYVRFRRWAESQGYRVPSFDLGKRYVEEPKQSGILDPRKIAVLRERCPPTRWGFFWALLGTGARQGEILNLARRDVAMVPAMVTVRSQPGSKARGQTRVIPISPDLAAHLLEIAADDPEARIFPLSRHIVDDWWNRLARECGISGVTLHGLRATYITTALDNGVPPAEVQKLVGHRHLATTMRYYRNREASRAAAAIIGSALGLEKGAEDRIPEPGHSGSHSGHPHPHPAGARK